MCGLETAAVLVVLGVVMASGQLASGEQLSSRLAWGVITIFGLPYLSCVFPAILFVAHESATCTLLVRPLPASRVYRFHLCLDLPGYAVTTPWTRRDYA